MNLCYDINPKEEDKMYFNKDNYINDLKQITRKMDEANLSVEEKAKVLMEIYQNNQVLYGKELAIKKELENIHKLKTSAAKVTPPLAILM